MREVPRTAFVPEDLAEFAYIDAPLPIAEGQTISQPYIVALMVEALDPRPLALCHARAIHAVQGAGRVGVGNRSVVSRRAASWLAGGDLDVLRSGMQLALHRRHQARMRIADHQPHAGQATSVEP